MYVFKLMSTFYSFKHLEVEHVNLMWVFQFILCGTYMGDVKMFNVHTGALESTYSCHDSQVTHIEMNREGKIQVQTSLGDSDKLAYKTPRPSR